MKTLIELISCNPVAPLFVIVALLFFVRKEHWLVQAKKHHQNPAITKHIMAIGILLAGTAMIVSGGFRLRLEQNQHRGELSVKDTKIRILNETIEHLKSK